MDEKQKREGRSKKGKMGRAEGKAREMTQIPDDGREGEQQRKSGKKEGGL